jgi:RNA exonuclease NGL2
LTEQQKSDILISHVVHATVDPTIPIERNGAQVDDDEAAAGQGSEEKGDKQNGQEESKDPDRVIVNARPARPEDGLLLPDEFTTLFREILRGGLMSVYDSWASFDRERTFASRGILLPSQRGHNEPVYTSYTHYWKTTLGGCTCLLLAQQLPYDCVDYIFVAQSAASKVDVIGILQPLTREELEPGIPHKGICGSDHIPLCAELRISPRASLS